MAEEEEEEWVDYDGGAVQEWHRSASHIRVASDVASIPEEAFIECYEYEELRAVDLNNVTTISDNAFRDCPSLERVLMPTASDVEIGRGAFASCPRLRAIDLSNVATIGQGAFFECFALERVTIPPSFAEIEAYAFGCCENLMEVELGEGIQRIGVGMFHHCVSLRRINIPTSVNAIEGLAFHGCSSLVEVELNEGVQHIGYRAFKSCPSLIRISLPSSTLKVGEEAFAHCRQLRQAELQEGLQVVGGNAFIGCRSMERINIPSSVKSVGGAAFQNCIRLAEVTLREGVHLVDRDAFHLCPSLERITIPPVALVIDIEGLECQLLRNTMPVERGRKLVVSKWMQYRSPHQIGQAFAKVYEILSRYRPTDKEKIACIREWFAYCDLLDVTSMLELAIWGCNIHGNERDEEARQASRRDCGRDMNVIIPGVLQFVDVSTLGSTDSNQQPIREVVAERFGGIGDEDEGDSERPCHGAQAAADRKAKARAGRR